MSEINNNVNAIIQPFIDIINEVLTLPEEGLTEETLETITNMMKASINEVQKRAAVQEILSSFKNLNLSKGEARQNVKEVLNSLNNLVDAYNLSANKKIIVDALFAPMHDIFNNALEAYLAHDIVVKIKLDDGAQVPTYAHDTDAAADLYAADTITIPAHSTSTMVRTGVHLGLPEGWMAMIFPRSSIGAKTGLRLSNSAGIIDSDYLGPLGVLYDNISDSDYTINAGDRIAQLMVMPSYHFKAEVVEALEDTERGEGGFGSSGK